MPRSQTAHRRRRPSSTRPRRAEPVEATAGAAEQSQEPVDAKIELRSVVEGRAHAVASAFAAFSGHNHYRRHRLHHPATAITTRRLRRGDVLSVPELAALAHLPVDEHVPGLLRAGAAAVAPPPHTPTPGPGVKPSGRQRRHPRPPGRRDGGRRPPSPADHRRDRLREVHPDDPPGPATTPPPDAGCWSSTPKATSIVDITTHLPARARPRMILIDPDHPLPTAHAGRQTGGGPVWPCLNPLAPHPADTGMATGPGVGDAAVENVVTVFSRLFSASWGFRTDDLLRVACLTLRAGPETPCAGDDPRTAHQPPRARPRHHPPPPHRQRTTGDNAGRSMRSWPATGAGSPPCPTPRGRR